MDNTIYDTQENLTIGIPYQNINWEEIEEQPFGLASQFNLFVFGDANNIVDVEGAVAVGGSFYSPRGFSIGFARGDNADSVAFSPDLARFLVGNVTSVKGPLVVLGHVIGGGNFQAALGSTYYIGKNQSPEQLEDLKRLYAARGGSPYWTPSDKEGHYLIPSYDVVRVIPAARIEANMPAFFQDARRSIEAYKSCIQQLSTNGTVTSNSHEWILTGTDPRQNVFTIDVSPNGLINKGIRLDIPEGSVAIVRLKTGPHAHLQYGLYGDKNHTSQTLYVFEDATNIHMEKSSDIWGSILAPQAMFHGHPTGGHVSGNAVLGSFAVNPNSGFEFHLYPFVGGVTCMQTMPVQEPQPVPEPVVEAPLPVPVVPQPEVLDEVQREEPVNNIQPPLPQFYPEPTPCPTCPEQTPCPEPEPCPQAPPCPTPEPCPDCPKQKPCPKPAPCPTCPEPEPCPTCPEQKPCPTCPTPAPCPACPECPKESVKVRKEPIPIPVPIAIRVKPQPTVCPKCEDCLIKAGIIAGCICGCDCHRNHEWDVMLYQMQNDKKILVSCITISHMGCFEFKVPYEESYSLKICPAKRNCFMPSCRPKIKFKNVGVANFTID